jgi:hypothetical protein
MICWLFWEIFIDITFIAINIYKINCFFIIKIQILEVHHSNITNLNNNNESYYSPQHYMIIYKHTFFIKILFEMNGGQPTQQELFLASLLE